MDDDLPLHYQLIGWAFIVLTGPLWFRQALGERWGPINWRLLVAWLFGNILWVVVFGYVLNAVL